MRSLFTCLFFIIILCVQAQLPKIENNQLVLDSPVTFNTGSDELTEDGIKALHQVKEFLTAKDYVSLLRVEGHSDDAGNQDDVQKLTEQRALVVCRWLVINGVDCKRLIAVGFGSTKPVEDNNTPAGRAANRRMMFAIAVIKGRMVGSMPADGGGIIAGDPCKPRQQ